MKRSDAKRILQLERAGTTNDAKSPEVVEALALVRDDPELRAWLENHQLVEARLRQSLRSVSVPAALREQILARRVELEPWSRRRSILALAAMLALLAVAALWWLRPSSTPDRFADYRQRMVSGVLRSYHMELETTDTGQVREFMARAGSPDDFEIPSGLARLELAGGGRLQWRGHPVSMICFDRGDSEMVFLFVIRGNALADAPPGTAELAQVNKLATMSWSRGENVYLLAGIPEPGFAERFP